MPTTYPTASTPDEVTSTATSMSSPRSQTADQLDYMADMISELRTMAQDGHLITLAGILSLAHAEAMQQMIARQKLGQN